jgi:hypothetical protein
MVTDPHTRLLLQADAEAAATPAAAVVAAAVDSSGAAAGTSGSLVELSVKWNKQDIVVHVEPDESVQVGRPCGANQAASAGRAGCWSLHACALTATRGSPIDCASSGCRRRRRPCCCCCCCCCCTAYRASSASLRPPPA